MRQFPVLETDRLKLVEMNQQFKEKFYRILSHDEVARYDGMSRLESIEEASEMIQSFAFMFKQQRGIRWGILLKETNELIGTVGLNNLFMDGKRAEIGYELDPDYWQKGYTSEAIKEVMDYAFSKLKLFRIGAITLPKNYRSIQLLQKLGFSLEGTLRGYLFQNGRSHDASIYSIIKPEWRKEEDSFEVEERLQYKDHMSEIIRKAEQDGHFDDLPGKGKPLKLDRNYGGNPYEAQLNKTLKDNHVLPRWVQLGNEIDQLKEIISTLDGKERRKKVKEVNKKIKEFNYACPPSLQRNKVAE